MSNKRGMRGEVGDETPYKVMDNRRIFMTSHMTLSAPPLTLSSDFNYQVENCT